MVCQTALFSKQSGILTVFLFKLSLPVFGGGGGGGDKILVLNTRSLVVSAMERVLSKKV